MTWEVVRYHKCQGAECHGSVLLAHGSAPVALHTDAPTLWYLSHHAEICDWYVRWSDSWHTICGSDVNKLRNSQYGSIRIQKEPSSSSLSNAIGRRSDYVSLDACFHYMRDYKDCIRPHDIPWANWSKCIGQLKCAPIFLQESLSLVPCFSRRGVIVSDRRFCDSQLLPLGQWCWRSSKLATQCIERKPRISSWSIGTRTTKATTTCSHQCSKE